MISGRVVGQTCGEADRLFFDLAYTESSLSVEQRVGELESKMARLQEAVNGLDSEAGSL